jgi:heptosyltransferase-2
MKRFLVIQTAFLGDAVLATGLLEKLHAWYPDAAIDLVVRKGNDGLFQQHPFLRKLFVWDKRQNKNRNLFALISDLRKTEYDHIINCQRFFSTGLMTVMARGKEKIGYDKNPLIAHLTDGTKPMPRLYPTPEARADAERLRFQFTEGEGRYVCIAPASVWFTKQWPEAKWIELIKALPQDLHVFLIGAPSDGPLCQRIIKAAGRGHDLSEELSLLASAALMEGAAMNYVNDSAPLHIASAMNAPVTAVFCSTVPAFGFGPLRANGRIVETTEKLDCRPCGLHGHKACPKGHFRCALGIEVTQKKAFPDL